MDPDRVRAYLQVACAGLGFDIGEIWWTHNDNGSSSALAAIGKKIFDAKAFDWRRLILLELKLLSGLVIGAFMS